MAYENESLETKNQLMHELDKIINKYPKFRYSIEKAKQEVFANAQQQTPQAPPTNIAKNLETFMHDLMYLSQVV